MTDKFVFNSSHMQGTQFGNNNHQRNVFGPEGVNGSGSPFPTVGRENTIALRPFCLAFIAKDHESKGFYNTLRTKYGLEITSHTVPTHGGETYAYSTFSLKGHTIAATTLQGMGKKIQAFVRAMLPALKPHSVCTVGICGGAEENFKRVFMFFKAKIEEEGEHMATQNSQLLPEGMWRENKEVQEMLVRATLDTRVLTIVGERPEGDVKRRMDDERCQGIDMEIGWIFNVAKDYNSAREEKEQVVVLPGIKSVSDAGNSADRDAQVQQCSANATFIFVRYMQYLLQPEISVIILRNS